MSSDANRRMGDCNKTIIVQRSYDDSANATNSLIVNDTNASETGIIDISISDCYANFNCSGSTNYCSDNNKEISKSNTVESNNKSEISNDDIFSPNANSPNGDKPNFDNPNDGTLKSYSASKMNDVRQLNECETKTLESDVDAKVVVFNDRSLQKCQQWLEQCSITDESGSSCDNSSVYSEVTSTTSETSDVSIHRNELLISNKVVCDNEVAASTLEDYMNATPHTYKNVIVNKSKNVTLGNITYITGPVTVNHNVAQINQDTTANKIIIDAHGLNDIITRKTWLAQPPRQTREYLRQPAKFVIISHTATEEAETIVENILIVRLIQQFHVESRQWNDIGYNFLIGGDGKVYEGRGYNVVGAHTYHFNRKSIGISFIGCFMDHLPVPAAINRLQPLIDYGVKIGAIAENYSLIAHCQCSAVESPGKKLFEEMKNWKHFDSRIMSSNSYKFLYENDKEEEEVEYKKRQESGNEPPPLARIYEIP